MKSLIDTTALWLLAAFGAIVYNDISKEAVEQKMRDLHDQAELIQARAETDGRALTAAEDSEISRIWDRFRAFELTLASYKSAGRQTDPVGMVPRHAGQGGYYPAPTARDEAGRQWFNRTFGPGQDDTHGFHGVGDFLGALRGVSEGIPDSRLQPYRTIQNAGMIEGAGSEGGFLVPQQLVADILGPAFVESGVLSAVNTVPMSSSALSVAGFNTRDNSSGGIAGLTLTWTGEGDTMSSQTPTLTDNLLMARKGSILVPVTNELLADAPAADIQLRQILQMAARFGLEQAILTGNGAGRPKGVTSDPALVTIAKESGQAADTLVYENIVQMIARLHPNLLPGAVWVANPTVLPQLLSMQFPIYDGASVVGGTQVPLTSDGQPAGIYSLVGIPLVFSEAMPTLGDANDIVLANFQEYMFGLRQDAQIAISQHLKFDEDRTVFRLVLRADGQGRWNGPATPLIGSTLSWCVGLAART